MGDEDNEITPSKSVLVIDDEEAIRKLLVMATAEAGGRADAVATVGEGRALVETRDYAFVVIDKNLPDASGLELLRFVRERQPRTEVIMITGYPSTETAVEAIRLGALDYISKPFDLEVVVHHLRLALERRRMRDDLDRLVAGLKAANERLERTSSIDVLTGLHTRASILAELDREVRRAQRYRRPISLLVIAVDDLDPADAGPEAVERLLGLVGKLLPIAVRSSDLSGRTDEQEFLVVAPETDGASAVRLGERLRAMIAERSALASDAVPKVTVSIGVATANEGELPAAELLRLAHDALGAAQRGGRNRVLVSGS
jgi:diguanylate cyclase (GGDEF)-like protein